MKTIKIIFAISLLIGVFACTEEPEIWDSATIEYAGNWVVRAYDVNGNLAKNSADMFTYNTAANIENEIWIDDEGGFLSMKFKASLDGTSNEFLSSRSDNIYFENEVSEPSETNALETKMQTSDYTAFEIISGSIVEEATLMNSGVYSDSIYMKVICYLNEREYTSYLDGTDTAWNVYYTDSVISFDVDTTIHEIPLDTTSSWYDNDWVQLNDTLYYQIDSTEIITYTTPDSIISAIDSLYKWTPSSEAIEVSEEYIISGYRYTGYLED